MRGSNMPWTGGQPVAGLSTFKLLLGRRKLWKTAAEMLLCFSRCEASKRNNIGQIWMPKSTLGAHSNIRNSQHSYTALCFSLWLELCGSLNATLDSGPQVIWIATCFFVCNGHWWPGVIKAAAGVFGSGQWDTIVHRALFMQWYSQVSCGQLKLLLEHKRTYCEWVVLMACRLFPVHHQVCWWPSRVSLLWVTVIRCDHRIAECLCFHETPMRCSTHRWLKLQKKVCGVLKFSFPLILRKKSKVLVLFSQQLWNRIEFIISASSLKLPVTAQV